ncbi:unnamed protein product, partial [Closterium sp. NIES-64]
SYSATWGGNTTCTSLRLTSSWGPLGSTALPLVSTPSCPSPGQVVLFDTSAGKVAGDVDGVIHSGV